MKVIIVSDTHGQDYNLYKVLKLHPDLDRLVHCGDFEGSEDRIRADAGCICEFVRGNNDFFSDLPYETTFHVGRYSCMVTHGHKYRANMGPDWMLDEARAQGYDVVIYGHTHRPSVYREDGIAIVNPGSLSYPRQEGRVPSYMIMELDRDGELHFTIAYME